MKLKTLAPTLITTALLAACGGGGGSDTGSGAATTSSTTLSGVASKGPLKKALVTAYRVDSAGKLGAKITEKETDDSGGYTLDLGSYTGAVQLVVSVIAGKTTSADEATGVDVSLPADFTLRATTVVSAPAGGGSTQVQNASITPFTELASKIAEDSGGLSAANIASATKVVFDLIGVDPVATKPINFSSAAPAGATDDQKRYALFNAAVSQMASGAPSTTDATTLACFTAAAGDAGKKIKCATDQISKSVTVSTSSGSATAAINSKLVGLGDALVAAASDSKNKTGTTITADDAATKLLKAIEKDVKASTTGTAAPIKLDTPAETLSDIVKAKLFFSRLRSNAAALKNGPLDTGLSDGVKAFGDSLNNEALAVTGQTGQLLKLSSVAFQLWNDYKSGATTNPNSVAIPGLSGGCTVYEGSFPVRFGAEANAVGSDGKPGTAYVGGSTTATSASAAAWVGCSVNQGTLPTVAKPGTQYRRSMLFDMSVASYPSTVPYIAVTRLRTLDGTGALVQQNLTPTFSGSISLPASAVPGAAVALVGDVPPSVTSAGVLMAARYAVNVQAALTSPATGVAQLALTAGSFAVVPVGASSASLTLDLSPEGATLVSAPVVDPGVVITEAQLALAKFSLAASIKTAQGELKGSLLADQFALDSFGDLQPNHLKFTGSIAAAGTGAAVAPFLTGTLEGTRSGTSKAVSFAGTLALPGRPNAALTLSVTETVASGNVSLTGRYEQDKVTVALTGSQTSSGQTLTLADSGGVSVSVASSGLTAAVTVSGRNAATVDKDRGRVTYADGTFETLN